MIVERAKGDLSALDNIRGGLLAITVFADERPPLGVAGLLDWRLPGKLSSWLKSGFFRASLGEKLLFTPGRRLACEKILLYGAGEYSTFASRRLEVAHALAMSIASLKEPEVFVACDGATPAVADALRESDVEHLLLLDTEPGRKPTHG